MTPDQLRSAARHRTPVPPQALLELAAQLERRPPSLLEQAVAWAVVAVAALAVGGGLGLLASMLSRWVFP